MDHLRGQIAVVTGSSAGIGAALAKQLVEAGLIVVGIARRIARLEVSFKKQSVYNLRHNLNIVDRT